MLWLALAAGGALPAAAQVVTPQEAYRKGCGGCHTSEARLLRKLPRGDAVGQRDRIATFMATHPCEADRLKPLIVDYLVSKTAK